MNTMSLKPKTLAIGILLLLAAGVGTYVAITTAAGEDGPPYFKGGRVGIPGSSGLVVENVRYDEDAHRVSFRLIFDAREPTQSIQETIHVMQFDPSDESFSEAVVAVPKVIDNQAGRVLWEVEGYALTPGLTFFGCRLTGRWVGTVSGESPLDGSIGGYWEL